jgi:hypothetical protein
LLKQIVHHSPKLVSFIALLHLNLSKPQRKHVQRIADAAIVSTHPHKTLRSLYDVIVDAPDATNAADCLRISPWTATDIRERLQDFVVADLLADAEATGERRLFISIDDSLTRKDVDTRHLEPVDFHHDHTRSRPGKPVYTNGLVHIEVRLQLGTRAYSFDHRLYMREKTIRRLNRHRPKGQRLRFRSKYNLARETLEALDAKLPTGFRVYVLFDSWYASHKLLKLCRRKGWHVICALKSNRCVNGKQVSQWNRDLKHRRYLRVRLTATEKKERRYLVRQVSGRLNKVPFDVCVFISKRHPRDSRPKYFLCTDTTLSAQAALTIYQKRWPIEVDNFYLKQALGLGDFRVQSFEAVEKWYAIVFLALTYLQWRLNHAKGPHRAPNLAAIIRQHREEHACQVLIAACEQAICSGDLGAVLRRFSSRRQLSTV